MQIKSLQRGTSSFSGTNRDRDVTVSAVVMAMSVVDHSWKTYLGNTNMSSIAVLETATNIRFSRGGAFSDSISGISWQLIEYE